MLFFYYIQTYFTKNKSWVFKKGILRNILKIMDAS